MWRSLFLAFGVYSALLGVEALALERAVLKPTEEGQRRLIQAEEIVPTDWAPWSLMAIGLPGV